MSKKRIMSILLLCSLLGASVLSCSKKEEGNAATTIPNDATTLEQETKPTDPLDTLPAMDFGGKEFRVLSEENKNYPQFSNIEVFSEAETGEVVNDAVFRRNRMLEERYNIVITQDTTDSSPTTLRKFINSNDDVYDASFISLNNMGTAVSNGFLMDLNALPHIDFNQSWWNKEVNDAVSIGGKLYFTTSDFTLSDKKRTYIMIYNKEKAEKYNLGNLNAIVQDGKWTLDKFNECCVAVSQDVDGDGKMTPNDNLGIGMESYNSFYVFTMACNNRIIEKDSNDMPQLKMNTPNMVTTIDKLVSILCDTTIAKYCDDLAGQVDYDHWNYSFNNFVAEKLLFTTSFPGSLKLYSAEANFEYGILPFPKLDEAQELYYSVPDPVGVMPLVVPSIHQDLEKTGFMLEALSIASQTTTLPAFYEISCKTKYTYDEESAKMLDLVFGNIVYDLGSIYNWGDIGQLLKAKIPQSKTNNFASEYAKRETKALKAMEKTMRTFAEANE